MRDEVVTVNGELSVKKLTDTGKRVKEMPQWMRELIAKKREGLRNNAGNHVNENSCVNKQPQVRRQTSECLSNGDEEYFRNDRSHLSEDECSIRSSSAQLAQSDPCESFVNGDGSGGAVAASAVSSLSRSGFANYSKGVHLRREWSAATGLRNSCASLEGGTLFDTSLCSKRTIEEFQSKFDGETRRANNENRDDSVDAVNDDNENDRNGALFATFRTTSDIDSIAASIGGLVASRKQLFAANRVNDKRQSTTTSVDCDEQRGRLRSTAMVDEKFKDDVYDNVNGRHYENVVGNSCYDRRPRSANAIRERCDSSTAYDSEDNELEYGPGIVDKLRCKFLRYTLVSNEESVCKSKLKKCSSLENLLGDGLGDRCLYSRSTGNRLRSGSSPIDIGEPVVRDQRSVNGCVYTANVGHKCRAFPPVLKRAKSVETLLLESRGCQTMDGGRGLSNGVDNRIYGVTKSLQNDDCSRRSLLVLNHRRNDCNSAVNAMMNRNEDEDDACNSRCDSRSTFDGEQLPFGQTATHNEMIVDELPKPDTVKNCKRIFETSSFSAGKSRGANNECVAGLGNAVKANVDGKSDSSRGCTYKKVVAASAVSGVKRKPPVLRAAENKAAVNAMRTSSNENNIGAVAPNLPAKPSFLVNRKLVNNSVKSNNSVVSSAKSFTANGSSAVADLPKQANARPTTTTKSDRELPVNRTNGERTLLSNGQHSPSTEKKSDTTERIRPESGQRPLVDVSSTAKPVNGNRETIYAKVNREQKFEALNVCKARNKENKEVTECDRRNATNVKTSTTTSAVPTTSASTTITSSPMKSVSTSSSSTTSTTGAIATSKPVANIKPFQLNGNVAITSATRNEETDSVVKGGSKANSVSLGCDQFVTSKQRENSYKQCDANTQDTCKVPTKMNGDERFVGRVVNAGLKPSVVAVDEPIETRAIGSWKSSGAKTANGTSSSSCSTNSMVFNFIGKKVTPLLTNRPAPFGVRSVPPDEEDDYNYTGSTEMPEPCGIVFEGERVIVKDGAFLITKNKKLKVKFNENALADTFEYPSEASFFEELSSEKTNSVIESNGSALNAVKNNLPFGGSGSGGLSNYKPTFLTSEQETFELGVSRSKADTGATTMSDNGAKVTETGVALLEDGQKHRSNSSGTYLDDSNALNGYSTLKPADSSETASWSTSSNASDLLF